MHRRVLFIQFTDPSAYPPLEHASHLLASRAWNVVLLGTSATGLNDLRILAHPRIRVKKIKFISGGWKQKLQYGLFLLWALYWTIRWKPHWIYASDPLSCP